VTSKESLFILLFWIGFMHSCTTSLLAELD